MWRSYKEATPDLAEDVDIQGNFDSSSGDEGVDGEARRTREESEDVDEQEEEKKTKKEEEEEVGVTNKKKKAQGGKVDNELFPPHLFLKLSSLTDLSRQRSPTRSSRHSRRPRSSCATTIVTALFDTNFKIRRSRSKGDISTDSVSVQQGEFYDLQSDCEDNNGLHVPGRQSRSASITSSSSAPASSEVTLTVPMSSSNATSPTPSLTNPFMATLMFDGAERDKRQKPEMPATTGIEYQRAASWAAGNCSNVLNDDKGRQLFRVFLFESLAEENLSFLEAVEQLKKTKAEDRPQRARDILNTFQSSINLSSNSMKALRTAVESDSVDLENFAPAVKEIKRLLENDQFPRFRRSEMFLEFLELLMHRQTAEKWAQSFESLLGNHVGRHHFRIFLRSIHAEENLRFWEAVVEFRSTRPRSTAMMNLARVIVSTYLAEGTANEVFLPFGVRQFIERRIAENDIDIGLFDEAIKHVEQVLRNDPYVRFLQSDEYTNLLSKLRSGPSQ